MTTAQVHGMKTAQLETGDVIELGHGEAAATALVLLASDDAVILDACDGTLPFVLRSDELVDYRKFDAAA